MVDCEMVDVCVALSTVSVQYEPMFKKWQLPLPAFSSLSKDSSYYFL